MCEMEHNCEAIDAIKAIKTTVDKIETALLGDEYNKEGIIEKVSVLESRIAAIEGRVSMVKWIAVGYAAAGVGLGATLSSYLL